MKTPKLFIFVLLLSCCCSTLSLVAAPRTLDEINEEREQKTEDEKKASKEGCDNNSGKACFRFAEFVTNEDEKLLYFSKACELEYQQGCEEANKIKAAQEAEKARLAEEERLKQEAEKERLKEEQHKAEKAKQKAEKEKERQIKEEINKAGRKKRIAIATSTFVPGVVISILGGVSLYAMNEMKKDRDTYFANYNNSTAAEDIEFYRRKTQDSDKKRKTYLALGAAGIGVGVALIATGITFYSIEFEGEKEAKKKYNVSFGTSPMDGTLQLAINW